MLTNAPEIMRLPEYTTVVCQKSLERLFDSLLAVKCREVHHRRFRCKEHLRGTPITQGFVEPFAGEFAR